MKLYYQLDENGYIIGMSTHSFSLNNSNVSINTYDFPQDFNNETYNFYQLINNELFYSKEKELLKKAEDLRIKRDELLTASDWTQINDVPLTDELKTAWKNYRQLLRDIPQQPGFPNTVDFPIPPSEVTE